ncbi:MAG: polyprenyl synthetase family protein [Theionarchaea archaeon]|nr:polyprenyl synthetase family protein [Theionarchaea archaeon]MBU7001885.1 polyprenyl synthetase family protein [Theionarchaea archaeon]MBU7019553.1 polyprenyl synthetase family protein [Theionarchaea archaeon]MBU7035681.1 polyprenyl synthetase family protein [Theionarchaea archaeon]MBU7039459.1 polyprenyl synthetase family protein [Theionarchaea archaeon]
MSIPVIFHEYMELINRKIDEVFQDDDPAIRDPALYHIRAGGKRARPILSVLTCQGLGGTIEDVLPSALALEILHNVSLIYDDMIDGNVLRRGQESLHVKYGYKDALLTANYLTWKALEVFSEKVKPAALKELAYAARMTTLGEKLDIDFSKVTEDEYMRICEAKTSYQFSVSTFLGAIAATDDGAILEESRRFGRNLGLAFQIKDDILNIVGKESVSGKPVGTDLLEGRPNFVVVKALEILGDSLYEGDTARKVVECGAVEEATKTAEDYLEKARQFLGMFTVDKYREMLDVMVQFIIGRTL